MWALATLTASCASTQPAEKGPPVMAGKVSELPVRSSVEFERVKQSGRTFLIQKSTWSDGSKARTLAGIWLEENTPVEIIVVDDLIMTRVVTEQIKPPFVLDLVPNLASLTIRNTGAFVDSEAFSNSIEGNKTMPNCEKSELRGIARLPGQNNAAVVCLQSVAPKSP
jgi:hypothetical protein